jgi:uncharacterized protein
MFFQAARQGGNEWWMYLLGFMAVVMGYLLGQVPLGIVLAARSMETEAGALREFTETMDFKAMGIEPNLGFLLALLMFVGAFLALWLAVRYIHGRPLHSLVNGYGKVRWSRFFYGLGLWTLFGVVIEASNYMMDPTIYHFQFEPTAFLVLAVIALVLIPIQTSFEELFVRGYLMQGIGLATRSRVVAVLLSSLLFMSLHLMNPEIGKFGLEIMVAYYFVVAVFLASITLLDQGLELAMGIHASTNLFGSLFVTFEGSALQTPALFRLDEPNAGLMLAETVAAILLFGYLAAQKYGWNDLRLLTGPMEVADTPAIAANDLNDAE